MRTSLDLLTKKYTWHPMRRANSKTAKTNIGEYSAMTRRLLYIICGVLTLVLIITGVISFMLVPPLLSALNTQPTPQPTQAIATTTPTTRANALGTILRQYNQAVKTQVATGLKLTPEELTTQLHSGKTLTAIATAQHLSLSQLQTLIATSLQTSLQPAVDSGDLTQQQLTILTKRMQKNPDTLGRFLQARTPRQQSTPPTATPPPVQQNT
jgi:hypothetical protein